MARNDPKKPGSMLSMKTKINEHSLVMQWINSQSNFADSIRYLIEQDIINNGFKVRNLQLHIPAQRSLDDCYLQNQQQLGHQYDSFANQSYQEVVSPNVEIKQEIVQDATVQTKNESIDRVPEKFPIEKEREKEKISLRTDNKEEKSPEDNTEEKDKPIIDYTESDVDAWG